MIMSVIPVTATVMVTVTVTDTQSSLFFQIFSTLLLLVHSVLAHLHDMIYPVQAERWFTVEREVSKLVPRYLDT